jgi:hypothetical protein
MYFIFRDKIIRFKHTKRQKNYYVCICPLTKFFVGSLRRKWIHKIDPRAVLFMIRYPEFQKRVQAEIDHVVGSSRMPQVSDRLVVLFGSLKNIFKGFISLK